MNIEHLTIYSHNRNQPAYLYRVIFFVKRAENLNHTNKPATGEYAKQISAIQIYTQQPTITHSVEKSKHALHMVHSARKEKNIRFETKKSLECE